MIINKITPTADYDNQKKSLDTTRVKQPIEITSQRIRDLVYKKNE